MGPHPLHRRTPPTDQSPPAVRNLRDPSSRVLNLDDSGPAPRRTGSGTGGSSSPTDALRDIYKDGDKYRRTAARRRTEIAETLRHKTISDQFLRQMPRQWRAGDVYAPHDLSPFEMKKWRRQGSPKKDVLDMLGVNPLDMYRVGILSFPRVVSHACVRRPFFETIVLTKDDGITRTSPSSPSI